MQCKLSSKGSRGILLTLILMFSVRCLNDHCHLEKMTKIGTMINTMMGRHIMVNGMSMLESRCVVCVCICCHIGRFRFHKMDDSHWWRWVDEDGVLKNNSSLTLSNLQFFGLSSQFRDELLRWDFLSAYSMYSFKQWESF